MITRRVNILGGRRRVWRNPVGRKTKQKVQEARPMMDDPKKAQELLGQITGKAVETMTVWADANQRVLRELVEFGATSAKEGVRLYAELQQSAIEALRDSQAAALRDRKSTRLNSSHSQISYAVFCLKKKKKNITVCHNTVLPNSVLNPRAVV